MNRPPPQRKYQHKMRPTTPWDVDKDPDRYKRYNGWDRRFTNALNPPALNNVMDESPLIFN